LISPIFVIFLLIKVSGIRMLELRADKRWGEDPEYQTYRSNTPVLFPRRVQ
jgi:steroid 5-alpha reductase family enzyme